MLADKKERKKFKLEFPEKRRISIKTKSHRNTKKKLILQQKKRKERGESG